MENLKKYLSKDIGNFRLLVLFYVLASLAQVYTFILGTSNLTDFEGLLLLNFPIAGIILFSRNLISAGKLSLAALSTIPTLMSLLMVLVLIIQAYFEGITQLSLNNVQIIIETCVVMLAVISVFCIPGVLWGIGFRVFVTKKYYQV